MAKPKEIRIAVFIDGNIQEEFTTDLISGEQLNESHGTTREMLYVMAQKFQVLHNVYKHYLEESPQDNQITISIRGEKVFTITSNGEDYNDVMWTSHGIKDKSKHTKALLGLVRVAFQVSERKLIIDDKRIMNNKKPITLG